ncbi:MAG: TetR/AcrR family transcriptional regulator [Treponema sp.]|nr:TetR/AcrR family transcriptional regulator [Treponema sp.]
MAGKTKVHERQTEQSRSWIFEALLRLMEKKTYGKISVADITKKAGVARQTFYRHYKSKDDVILQFFDFCVNPPPPERVEITHREDGRDTFIFMLPLDQYVRHAGTIKRILMSEAEYLLILHAQKWQDYMINLYDGKLSGEEKTYFRYMIKFSGAGAIQIFCDWIKNDMPISVEKLKTWLTAKDRPYYQSYRNIPKIVLKVKN